MKMNGFRIFMVYSVKMPPSISSGEPVRVREFLIFSKFFLKKQCSTYNPEIFLDGKVTSLV